MPIDLKAYFKKLYFQQKGKKLDEDLLKMAIVAGKEDFWSSYPWAFKEKSKTVTTVSGTETVDLPEDFEGLINVRERTTTGGMKLTKLSPSEYDRLVPYSADTANYTPHTYKVYPDREDGRWRLALYPTPSAAISLYINYHVLEDGGAVPQKYIAALIAATTKYFFMVGSLNHTGAVNAFNLEVERLKLVDNVDVEEGGKMLDSSDAPNLETNFSEYVRVVLWL